MHLQWQHIFYAEFCVLQPVCVCFCVCVHAQTVKSKERKALCFLYTLSFLSVSKSATKEGKHRDDWIKTLLHPYTPAHTCKYIPNLPGFFSFIQSRMRRAGAAVIKSTPSWGYINLFSLFRCLYAVNWRSLGPDLRRENLHYIFHSICTCKLLVISA